MIWLPDSTVEHLTAVAGWPEFASAARSSSSP